MRKAGADRQRRRAYSLVELIAITTITAIVAAVAVGVATKAIVFANNARVAVEMSRLNEAIAAFYMTFGDYPPDFHDMAAVKKFLRCKFPKCPPRNYPNLEAQSPASALYFWLAGPQGQGFSANPANPFDHSRARISPFFAFSPDRLKRVGSAVQYFPPRWSQSEPYVYFRGGPKGYAGHPGWSTASPYCSSDDGRWINGEAFQILCAGDDGKFGTGNHFPAGDDYSKANLDDITSFSDGYTLKQSMPAR